MRSWRPLVVAGAGFVVLLPHLHWLATHHFMTFGYAEQRTGGTLRAAIGRFGIYTLAQIAYLLPSFGFVVLLLGEGRLKAAKWMALCYVRPSLCAELWWLALGPLIGVGVIAAVAKTQMASVWGMAEWFALVPLWLVAIGRQGVPVRAARAERVLVVYWLLVLVGAAAAGYAGARRNTDEAAEPRAELAAAANVLWAQRVGGGPIPVVSGGSHEAQSIAFYGDRRTRYWEMGAPRTTPWLSGDEVRRRGLLVVCAADDSRCTAGAAAWSDVSPVALAVRKRAWGRTLPARRYLLFPVPPAAAGR